MTTATNNPWSGLGASPAAEKSPWESLDPSSAGNALMGALQSAGYPAMPNQFGLGQGAVPGTASNPNYMTQKLTSPPGNESSRGFNPWSLMGESNARGN